MKKYYPEPQCECLELTSQGLLCLSTGEAEVESFDNLETFEM